MGDSREAFEKWYTEEFGRRPTDVGYESSITWVAWVAGCNTVSVPKETLTAIHDTLRMVWSRELSADDGLEEIEGLVGNDSAWRAQAMKLIGAYSERLAQLEEQALKAEPVGTLTVDHHKNDPAMQNVDYEHGGGDLEPGKYKLYIRLVGVA